MTSPEGQIRRISVNGTYSAKPETPRLKFFNEHRRTLRTAFEAAKLLTSVGLIVLAVFSAREAGSEAVGNSVEKL